MPTGTLWRIVPRPGAGNGSFGSRSRPDLSTVSVDCFFPPLVLSLPALLRHEMGNLHRQFLLPVPKIKLILVSLLADEQRCQS
jgi:hypothetical protein